MKTLRLNYEPKWDPDSELFLKVTGTIQIQSDEHPHWFFPLHSHEDMMEISLVLDGEGSLYYRGHAYLVEKGDLIVREPGVLHSEAANPDTQMNQAYILFTGIRTDGTQTASLLPSGLPPVLRTGSMSMFFQQFILYVMDIYERRPEGFEQILHHTLKALLSAIQQVAPQPETDSDVTAAPSIMREIVEYAGRHYAERITLDHLSHRFYFSPCYLARKFKDETGFTLNNYMVSLRMGEAQKMLLFEDYSIQEVARRAGYTNLQYFYATFRKYAGCTPVEFRQRYLSGVTVPHPDFSL